PPRSACGWVAAVCACATATGGAAHQAARSPTRSRSFPPTGTYYWHVRGLEPDHRLPGEFLAQSGHKRLPCQPDGDGGEAEAKGHERESERDGPPAREGVDDGGSGT